MNKILFITSTRIGDAVLSTGILQHIATKYPDAKVTVACGPLVSGFFEAAPFVEKVIPLNKQKRAGHWRKLWWEVVTTQWDMVVDLRNSAVSRLIWARQRFITGRYIDKSLHKAAQNAAVLGLEDVPDLHLWLTQAQREKARMLMGKDEDNRPILAIGPAANWLAKTWPSGRFIELMTRLTDPDSAEAILPTARIAVIAAPGEEEQARPVLEAVPQDRRIDLIAKGRPEDAAACIAQCDLYIGNDSGLMHCAAAAAVPTFGLFGPSWPHLYSPWGEHTAYMSTPESFSQLIDYVGYSPQTAPCLMGSLQTEDVVQAVKAFWQELKSKEKAA